MRKVGVLEKFSDGSKVIRLWLSLPDIAALHGISEEMILQWIEEHNRSHVLKDSKIRSNWESGVELWQYKKLRPLIMNNMARLWASIKPPPAEGPRYA